MCRICVCLQFNPESKDEFYPIIINHFKELEVSMGGDGNGIFYLKQRKIRKFWKVNEKNIPQINEPFLFHTRFATSGERSLINAHPYYYKGWVYCQNGSVSSDSLDIIQDYDYSMSDSYNWGKYLIENNLIHSKYLNKGNWVLYNSAENKYYIAINTFMYLVNILNNRILTSQITQAIEGYRYKPILSPFYSTYSPVIK